MKKRLLIANRSEIAIRIIRTARKLKIYTIVFQSDKEPDALYLKFADEVIPAHDADDDKPIFLNPQKIVELALQHEVDMLHPAYGFLSENPDFAALCIANNINFIGPSPDTIRDMGLKTIARKMAMEAGLPLVPGSDGALANVEGAKSFADKIGYPVILKASAGGGGRGMRIVENADNFERSFKSAYDEALSAFGNGDIFIERFLSNPKHLEFQILGDKHGNIVHLGERECSLQRKHQKLIEEAPSASITPAQREEMGQLAVLFAQKIGYYSTGTIEFIIDEDGSHYFMEMNTRIQVEHPVTEMVTGVDLVEQQIRIALGEVLSLKQEDIKIDGWAIECRVNAEDPQNRFTPQTGFIDKIHFPRSKNIRIETGFISSSIVTPYFDSMIAKIIVHGKDREEAIQQSLDALNQFNIIGLKTTVPFCKTVLTDSQFVDGTYTTRWVDQVYMPEMLENEDDELIGALAATILYASEYLQLQGDIPAYENDDLNVWVLNKRLTY